MSGSIRTIKALVNEVDFAGQSLHSINDLRDEQIYAMFELAKALEPFNRSRIDLFPGDLMATLFFQPSTRTRMSFETAMNRLGGMVVSEAAAMISSSAAKEESLADMLACVSQYANIIVLRHPNDVEAREAAPKSTCPVISGGWGHWEHPTQALLDLYALYRKFGKIEDLKVCVAAADMVEARTGHSMAQGLARLGADVTIASPKDKKVPEHVLDNARKANPNARITEVFDVSQDSFNELISDMDEIYLPGCSAPKGETADAYKKVMDDYMVRGETLAKVRESGRDIYVTHTLPRRAGEMDLSIDDTPSQLAFEAIGHSVSLRMALVASMLGL